MLIISEREKRMVLLTVDKAPGNDPDFPFTNLVAVSTEDFLDKDRFALLPLSKNVIHVFYQKILVFCKLFLNFRTTFQNFLKVYVVQLISNELSIDKSNFLCFFEHPSSRKNYNWNFF